jgi:hypothetical protein
MLCGTGARDTGGKTIILVKNFEIVCARGGKVAFLNTFFLEFSENCLPWLEKKFKIEETFISVCLEIYGIPYMKKVTEFREIPRNFTELYNTELGGIPPEF